MSERYREVGIWLAAAADVILGFLLARFGAAWFGLDQTLAMVLGIGIAVASVGAALWMSSRERQTED